MMACVCMTAASAVFAEPVTVLDLHVVSLSVNAQPGSCMTSVCPTIRLSDKSKGFTEALFLATSSFDTHLIRRGFLDTIKMLLGPNKE